MRGDRLTGSSPRARLHALRAMSAAWLIAFFILFSSGPAARAEARVSVRVGDLIEASLFGEADEVYAFTPAANGMYDVLLFFDSREAARSLLPGAYPAAAASLSGPEGVIAEGEGPGVALSARLNAGTPYTLRLRGYGHVRAEVARQMLSRSFGSPLPLEDGEGYAKLIAMANDVHWYVLTPGADGPALISAKGEAPGMGLRLGLYGANGHYLGASEMLASGTAVLSAELVEGGPVLIRVSAGAGVMGKYALDVARAETAGRAETVRLGQTRMTIAGRGSEALGARLYPENSCGLVLYDCSDPRVAQVGADGTVIGLAPGAANVVAYAWGGARSTCRVTVAPVAAARLRFDWDVLSVEAGSEVQLSAAIEPANATERTITWSSTDERVVTVDGQGRLSAIRPGRAQVIAEIAGREVTARLTVTVTAARPRYRALLIGEQDYALGVNARRDGSADSLGGVRSALETASFRGEGYRVTARMDVSRDEAVLALRECFGEASDGDVSVLYITCHGFYQNGMTFFVMTDGSVLSAQELAQELAGVRGRVLVLADCCGSGGLTASAGSMADITRGIDDVFTGVLGGQALGDSRVTVIASAFLEQNSYRIRFGDGGEMSTVFARALCDGLGWSLDRDARAAMNADADYDGSVTTDELAAYLARRVKWYLEQAGGYAQNVCVWPTGDSTVIFERSAGG